MKGKYHFKSILFILFSLILITSSFYPPTFGGEVNPKQGIETIEQQNTVSTQNIIDEKLEGEVNQYYQNEQLNTNEYKKGIVLYSSKKIKLEDQFIPPIPIGSSSYISIADKISRTQLRELALNPAVKKITPDYNINYTALNNPQQDEKLDSFQADDILRTDEVHSTYGINGSGVKIGIIDTGVDFGISDLSDAPVLTSSGYTASFDPTGSGIALASERVSPTVSQGNTILPLEGLNLTVWSGEQGQLTTSQNLGISLENLDISNLPNKSISGIYRVGMGYQVGLQEGVLDQYFLFVLADTKNSGKYNTLYVDFNTSLAITLSQNGVILPSSQRYFDLAQWSLNGATAFGKNNPIVAADLTGDGVNDMSMGALATVLDPNLVSRRPIIEGIDPDGAAIGVMYDSVGHGTLSAGVAAGRGETKFPVYDDIETEKVENKTLYDLPGSAPGASLIATKGFTISDFILGWLWTAGLELSQVNGSLGFVENLNLLVDISSNSWGSGVVAEDNVLKGFDFYSLFLDYLSTSSTLYPTYPGVLFVVSSGNGGPGFGTTARPGMGSMAITVSGSTYYHHLNGSKGRNDVAWFSGRGPSPYGMIKPDVLTPAHTGFTLYQVIRGLGNGTYARGTYGGTSEAGPRAAGVIALIFQAYNLNSSGSANLENVKLALQSTARDLGFHPTQQGAGLIDAFKAVSSIIKSNQVLVSTPTTSQLIGDRLNPAFNKLFDEDHPFVTNPIDQYMTVITPKMMSNSFTMNIHYGNGTIVNTTSISNIDIVRRLQTSRITSSYQTSQSEVEINLNNQRMPNGWNNSDLVEFNAVLDERSFEDLVDNGLETPDLILRDSQSERIVADLLSFQTYSQLLYSGDPSGDFDGNPVLTFTDPGFAEQAPSWIGLNYSIGVRSFNDVPWTDISINLQNGSIGLSGNISNETQFATVELNLNTGTTLDIPIHINHQYSPGFGDNISYAGQDLASNQPMAVDSIVGTFDPGYRPESGEFRYYQFQVPSQATFLAIFGQWDADGLIPNLYIFNSTGDLVVKTPSEYIGGGLYESEISDNKSQNLLVKAKDQTYYVMAHFSNLPHQPGPYKFKLYSRYLTISELPTPNPSFSQSLQSPISGTLNVDATNYSIQQFPELYVQETRAQVYQGRNETFGTTVPNSELKPGVVEDDFDSTSFDINYPLTLEKGENIDVKLSWEGSADVDLYAFREEVSSPRSNDLLSGTGTTPGNSFEHGTFPAEQDGVYFLSIDYITGLDNQDLNITLQIDSRKGPTITDGKPTVDINSELFPDGEYGLKLIFDTNFNVKFNLRLKISFENYDTFNFEITSPSSGEELSGDISVEWTGSGLKADVYVISNGISTLVAGEQTDNSATFDSTVFPNQEITIRVEATDGISSKTQEVSVTLDNSDRSTLPPYTSSQIRNLSLSLFPLFFAMVLIAIIASYRYKKIR